MSVVQPVSRVKSWLIENLTPKGSESKEGYLARVESEFGSKFTSSASKAANELWDEEQDWKQSLQSLVDELGTKETALRLEVSARTVNRWLATAKNTGAGEKRAPKRENRVKIADAAADKSLRLRG